MLLLKELFWQFFQNTMFLNRSHNVLQHVGDLYLYLYTCMYLERDWFNNHFLCSHSEDDLPRKCCKKHSTDSIHVVAFHATFTAYNVSPYFATTPRTCTNISLLSFTVINHCNSFWLQPLKMPENVSLLFTILFCFPDSRYFHLCKNEETDTHEKKIPFA